MIALVIMLNVFCGDLVLILILALAVTAIRADAADEAARE